VLVDEMQALQLEFMKKEDRLKEVEGENKSLIGTYNHLCVCVCVYIYAYINACVCKDDMRRCGGPHPGQLCRPHVRVRFFFIISLI
jgi:hypothetical protein